ncbi:MAG: hypothetical protein ACRDSF_24340, partial [Pseudonocardiaceae bacterium]
MRELKGFLSSLDLYRVNAACDHHPSMLGDVACRMTCGDVSAVPFKHHQLFQLLQGLFLPGSLTDPEPRRASPARTPSAPLAKALCPHSDAMTIPKLATANSKPTRGPPLRPR